MQIVCFNVDKHLDIGYILNPNFHWTVRERNEKKMTLKTDNITIHTWHPKNDMTPEKRAALLVDALATRPSG